MQKMKQYVLPITIKIVNLASVASYVLLLKRFDQQCDVGATVVSLMLLNHLSTLVFLNLSASFNAQQFQFWLCKLGFCFNLGFLGIIMRAMFISMLKAAQYKLFFPYFVLASFAPLFLLSIISSIIHKKESKQTITKKQ